MLSKRKMPDALPFTEKRMELRRSTDLEVDHAHLLEKLVENETKIDTLGKDLHGINQKLDPIVTGIGSIAFAFKGLLIIGAGSAAVVGIIELANHIP